MGILGKFSFLANLWKNSIYLRNDGETLWGNLTKTIPITREWAIWEVLTTWGLFILIFIPKQSVAFSSKNEQNEIRDYYKFTEQHLDWNAHLVLNLK